MALRVVGAGLGRTGTNSLKLALERLLGGRCYHMSECMERPGDAAVWHAALRGEPPEHLQSAVVHAVERMERALRRMPPPPPPAEGPPARGG